MLRFRHHESAQAATPALPLSTESTPSAPRIDAHLDRVEARLGILPADVRVEIRRELRQHVDALIAAHRELAHDETTEGEIETAALRQFGEPEQIAGRFLRAWKSTNRERLPRWTYGLALLFHVECLISFLYTVPEFVPNPALHVLLTTVAPVLFLVLPVVAAVWIGRVAAAAIGQQKSSRTGVRLFYLIGSFALSVPFYCWGFSRLCDDESGPFHANPPFVWWLALGWGLAMVTHQIVSRRYRRAGRVGTRMMG